MKDTNRKNSGRSAAPVPESLPLDFDHLGIDPEPDRIRLGGKRTLSLNFKNAEDQEKDYAELEPAVHLISFDFERFVRQAPLTIVERAVFLACYRRGIPECRLPGVLGLTPNQVRAALASICVKLSGPAGKACACLEPDSVAFAYPERLASGRRSWELRRLDRDWLKNCLAEKEYLLSSQWLEEGSTKNRVVSCRISMDLSLKDLNEKRTTAQAHLARLTARVGTVNAELDNALQDLERSQADIAAAREAAELDERPFDARAAEKAIADAQVRVNRARAGAIAACGAASKQATVVAGIEGQIEQRKLEAFRQTLAPAKKALGAALRELVRCASQVNVVAYQSGIDAFVLGSELFPAADPKDTLADFVERTMEAQLVNAALALQGQMTQRYGRPYSVAA